MKINLKELINYTKLHTLRTIDLNNLELDLCLLEDEKPTPEHIFNALCYFHDCCVDRLYEDVIFIDDILDNLYSEFMDRLDMKDENLIFAVGKYNNKEYLIRINIDLSGLIYASNPDREPDTDAYPIDFIYKIEVDGVWDV